MYFWFIDSDEFIDSYTYRILCHSTRYALTRNLKNWGEDANKFIGDCWVGTNKTAASISTSCWPFGFGRFACPGRFLAVAEIKLMVLHLISRVDIFMEDGKYEVMDPMNTVDVTPRGKLFLLPEDKPLL
ncbi:hypothetical protein C0991_005513 [Blastosporella zonata]|nr:hypothetical protein C0991_005513 [Blastosporella zonata]